MRILPIFYGMREIARCEYDKSFYLHHAGGKSPAPNIVIGLGNEIVGDDGVGIFAAHQLRWMLRNRTDIEVVPLTWAGFALLDLLSGRKRAAIIDCLCTGSYPPGSIVHLTEDDFRGSVRLNSFHDIDFSTVLALGRKIGWQMPEEIAIWGIEGEQMYIFSESLSPQVEASVVQVVDEVLDFLMMGKKYVVQASACSKAT